ncbi:MAG: tyrosine-type recombinase/integrase [Streptosporangiaceae bacterium]
MPDPDIAAHLDSLRLRGLTEETTIHDRRIALARMARTLGTPLIDADEAALLAWRRSLSVSPGSAARYIAHAREFYAWAQATGRRDGNPAGCLPIPKLGRRLPRPISEDDLMTALDAAPRRIRLWLVLAAWCGLRAKEIALLRVGCIQIAADPPVLLVAADATKGLSERAVPLCSFVVGEITAAGLPGSGYAFRREDGQPGPNKPNLVSKLANQHLHAMGIGATLHQLRHRFGTQAYRARRDLRMTQELMGHARPETTAGYAAWDQPEALAALEDLPAPGRRLRAVRRRGAL